MHAEIPGALAPEKEGRDLCRAKYAFGWRSASALR